VNNIKIKPIKIEFLSVNSDFLTLIINNNHNKLVR
jgi:hypothetical protein